MHDVRDAPREQVDPGEARGEAGPGPREHLVDRPVLDDPPVLQHDGAVRQEQDVEQVVGHQERGAGPVALRVVEDRAHVLGDADVERGERLVEQEDARVGRQGSRDRDALRLPTGQVGRPTGPEVPRPDPGEHPPRLAASPDASAAPRAQPERDVVLDGEVLEQQRTLAQPGDVPAPGGCPGDVGAVDDDPRVAHLARGQEPRDDLHERRLPGPVPAEDRDDLAGGEREVDVEAAVRDDGAHRERGGGRVHARGGVRAASPRRPLLPDDRTAPSRTARARARPAEDARAVDGGRDDHRDDHEDERQRDGAVRVGAALQVDLEGQGLRDALQGSREREGRAELAEGAREREDRPGEQPGQDARDRDAPQDRRRARAERRGDVLVAGVLGAQRALEAQDEERERDERLRHDDGGRGEGDLDPEHLEVLADQPPAAERVEQRDAAHDGRQHERQQDERARDALAGERRAGEDERHRRAQQDAEHGRRQRRAQRQPERVDRGRRRDERPEPARPVRARRDVDAPDHRHHGDDDEQRAEQRRGQHPAGEPAHQGLPVRADLRAPRGGSTVRAVPARRRGTTARRRARGRGATARRRARGSGWGVGVTARRSLPRRGRPGRCLPSRGRSTPARARPAPARTPRPRRRRRSGRR